MPEVRKRKILIASVLKPVNDTRMAEKIAQSLAETLLFEVHVIGFPSTANHSQSFKSHPLPRFDRLSFARLTAGWKIFRKILVIKPDLLIIATHELLCISLAVKLLIRCKVIYDIQENYFLNILHTSAFPYLVRPLIAFYVRLKEYICSPFIDHFFLAERAYAHELSFHRGKFVVLENKIKRPSGEQKRRSPSVQHFLFSGTLAESTGVFTAIEIAHKLFLIDKNITLTIIGYCPQKEVLKKIKRDIYRYPFIKLIGGDHLVSHQEILKYIRLADAGIIAYPDNVSTHNSIPTKLFEYLGYELPILLIDHPHWVAFCESYQSAVVFDPDNIDAEMLLQKLNTQSFYVIKPREVFWEPEAKRLLHIVNQVLN